MKALDVIFSVMIVASVVLCQHIVTHAIANQRHKTDYAELNHIKYGLLSIDAWKEKITAILTGEVDKLYLSRSNERLLRQHIEVLLNKLIDQIDRKIKEDNSDSLGGQITQSLINIFLDLDHIKKGIPEYTNTVIREIKKAETKEQIKATLNKQLEEYSRQTFDTKDTSQIHRILLETDPRGVESAKLKLAEDISLTQRLIAREVILLIILSVVPFAVSGFSKRPLTVSRFILLALPLLILLIGGVTTPTIDLEAKISHMSFVLIGYPVRFENQVLYFQSKSILDMFRILIVHEDLEMKFVGVLLIAFSIVFPLLKIASSVAHYFDYRHARQNPLIEFFVLKSGKWSMADVMVIAIFMAYIGFNGIIADQLDQFNSASQDVSIFTTNGTTLQPGFYLFLTYTLLALFFSEFLARKAAGSPAVIVRQDRP
jgi:hypothetical protein